MNTIRHVILGLFFFVTLVVLGFVTIYLGDFSLQHDQQELVAHFDQVDALAAGDAVFVWGVKSGRVHEVAFNEGETRPERRLRVVFKLDEPVVLRRGYSVEIGSPNFLGGKQLDVFTGTGEPIAASEYRELQGKSTQSIVRQLSSFFGDNADELHTIVAGLASIVNDVDTGKRPLAAILLDQASHADLNASIASVKSIVAKADTGDGSIARAINSPELHQRMVGFFENGEGLLGDIRTKPGALHDLIYDEQIQAKVRSGIDGISAAAERIGRGEGLLGKATSAESEKTWNDFAGLMEDARAISADARAGKGALGKLLNDPEVEAAVVDIAKKFGGIANDVAVIVDGARRGRGVLGLLVSDDQARRTVERIIDQLDRALEDAREAAPVSSVGSFLFGQL